jgi:hypothetical protein
MNYRRDGTASWTQSGVSTHQRSHVFLCQTSVITRDIVKTVRAYNEAVRVEGFLVCARTIGRLVHATLPQLICFSLLSRDPISCHDFSHQDLHTKLIIPGTGY